MLRKQQPAVSLFAIGMIALGTLSVIYKDFAYGWQPIPAFHPGREALAVISGLFMIAAGIALLFRATSALAARAFFIYLIVWQCLKIPLLLAFPKVEGVWLAFGETGMLLAGGWVLFALLSGLDDATFFRHITGARGVRMAQILFGICVLPVGLSHIMYVHITTSLVPSWLPFRAGFAYLTGYGQMACGLGILFLVLPRAAAYIETVMLALFAFLVWGPNTWFASTPKMGGSPTGHRFPVTAFLITWVIGAASLLIAANIAPNSRSISRNQRNTEVDGEVARI